MYLFQNVKLVIWDLDDTLWKGTFSEGPVTIPPEHRTLLHTLADIGIVSSICSKNDPGHIIPFLEQSGLRDFFCFPSIAWTPKGPRVQQLITDMQLRPCNVLFLDDNPSNLGEVRHYCPDIMTGGPDLIPRLIREADAAEKKDLTHSRLRNYRLLEEKHNAKKEFASNEEFLYESCICAEIHSDCLNRLDRIHDLILRSNQLNFTKIRSTRDELLALLEDSSIRCGYVTVRDRFGDYGIVGFFALQDGRLLHFVFSCRALGMGIEQYVYNSLGRPDLTVVGEVVSDLSCTEIPGWINHSQARHSDDHFQIHALSTHSVLMKGPCDLIQILPFIAGSDLFDTEFTYTLPNGTFIESVGHTTNILEALRLSDARKRRIAEEFAFLDMGMYSDRIFRGNYRVVFLSILTDCNLGVYRRKDTGEQFAFGEYLHPLTDAANWPGLIRGEYYTANFPFTESILKDFAENTPSLGEIPLKGSWKICVIFAAASLTAAFCPSCWAVRPLMKKTKMLLTQTGIPFTEL